METQDQNQLEEKVRSLTEENAKLKKTNLWLTILAFLVLFIQLYNLAKKLF